MVDIAHKKCISCNLKRAYFNYKDEEQLYCNDCRKCDMVDITHKRCIICDFKNPCFNYTNEKNIIL